MGFSYPVSVQRIFSKLKFRNLAKVFLSDKTEAPITDDFFCKAIDFLHFAILETLIPSDYNTNPFQP
jgi:hypothetical protein